MANNMFFLCDKLLIFQKTFITVDNFYDMLNNVDKCQVCSFHTIKLLQKNNICRVFYFTGLFSYIFKNYWQNFQHFAIFTVFRIRTHLSVSLQRNAIGLSSINY